MAAKRRKKPKVTVIAQRGGVSVSVMQYDANDMGSGFSSFLSYAAAVQLADQLNAALDDPNEQEAARLLKKRRT